MADFLGSYNTATTRTRVGFSFTTHAQTGAAVAPSSAFENADILIYRAADNGAYSATQRSSTSGITMTSPFDSITGLHLVDIDLQDNTDSGFYAAGYRYMVVLSPDTETVDTLVVVRVLAYFEIGAVPAVNVTQWLGTAAATPATAGIPDVNVKNAGNVAWASGSLTSGVFAANAISETAIGNDAISRDKLAPGTGLKPVAYDVAQAGAAGSLTLAASSSATTDFYKGYWLGIVSGLGTYQWREISAYDATTKVATVSRNFTTTPDNSAYYVIVPRAYVNVGRWLDTAVATPNTGGVPLVDVTRILGTTSKGTAGYVGIDWAQVTGQSTSVNLSATTTNLVNTVTTYTGNTVQTGDVYAKLPTNFSSLSIDASGRVDVIKIAGTTQTARDIGASVLLSNGTGTGQVKLASGYVAMTWADIAAPTTTVNLSGTTVGVVTLTNTATTVTNQLTAAAIATGVWQDATAGDFTTSSSIGKALYTGNFAPGATSGLAIVGSAMTLAAGYSDVVQTGTASAGATTTITIATALGTTADPVGMLIRITSGTGANQERIITGYVNATKVVTVNYAWVTTPDNTSVYAISFANAPKIDSNLKISGVVLADTITTYTGNTVQTGDSYSRIGAAGAGLTAVALTTTQTFNNTGTWTGNIVGTLSTLTTYTGNTPQTGDAYAQTNSGTFGLSVIKGYVDDIGVAGAGLTALGDTRIANLDATVSSRSTLTQTQVSGGAYAINSASFAFNSGLDFTTTQKAATLARVTLVDTTTTNTDMITAAQVRAAVGLASANLDTQLAAIAGYIDTEVVAIKAITDQFGAAQAEPTSVPAANATPLEKIAWLAMLARNKVTQTTTTQLVRNNADSGTIGTAAISDDGVTFVRGKFA